MIRLRPHHGLCLLFYRGNGYSATFVRQMDQICGELRAAEETLIELVRDADDLCAACPERTENRCRSEKPFLYDEQVLSYSRHHYGEILRWADFREEMKQLATTVRTDICGDCQWSSLCTSVRL